MGADRRGQRLGVDLRLMSDDITNNPVDPAARLTRKLATAWHVFGVLLASVGLLASSVAAVVIYPGRAYTLYLAAAAASLVLLLVALRNYRWNRGR